VPEFCRVAAVTRPADDSEIHFEVWLPSLAKWNGKFEGTGKDTPTRSTTGAGGRST
jgi:hypothetical protein